MLHMPLARAKQEITREEYLIWEAEFGIHPWGSEIDDIRLASMKGFTAAIRGIETSKLGDLELKWYQETPKENIALKVNTIWAAIAKVYNKG